MLPGIINEKGNCLYVRDDISEKRVFIDYKCITSVTEYSKSIRLLLK